MEIWENNLPFRKIRLTAIPILFISFFLVAPQDGPTGIDSDFYHITSPIHLIGIALLIIGLADVILTSIWIPRQEKWQQETERKARKRTAKKATKATETVTKKKEELPCPQCGHVGTFHTHTKYQGERLVGVRNVPEGDRLYEVEDYDVSYLIIDECSNCGYHEEYTESDRHSITVRKLN